MPIDYKINMPVSTDQFITQAQLGPHCKLISIAAPDADSYYKHIGYAPNPRCWVLDRDQRIRGMR